MNNQGLNFDPMTGQPLNNNQGIQQPINTAPVQPQTANNNIPTGQQIPIVDNTATIQQQLQSTPTVDQTKEQFINNSTNVETETKEEPKDSINITFFIVVAGILLAAMYFLFPYLIKFI